jgi:hypothetical protein
MKTKVVYHEIKIKYEIDNMVSILWFKPQFINNLRCIGCKLYVIINFKQTYVKISLIIILIKPIFFQDER